MNLYIPIANKGIAYLNKSELKICFSSILGIFVFWNDIMNLKVDIFLVNFVGTKKIIFCFINFLIYIIISFLYYIIFNIKINSLNGGFRLKLIIRLKQLLTENFDSNLKVIQSVSIIFVLLQINYNKYLGKIISFIGTLTFGVYLIHYNKYIKSDILCKLFKYEQNNIDPISVYRLFITKSLLIFIICLIIDYSRYYLFNLLKIRNICVILEKKILGILN